jgi:hypothetical protein
MLNEKLQYAEVVINVARILHVESDYVEWGLAFSLHTRAKIDSFAYHLFYDWHRYTFFSGNVKHIHGEMVQ